MNCKLPVLYSFRRCPYAIRARMALAASGVRVQVIEVDLKHKPDSLLTYSPKGTVPVLIIEEQESIQVIEQSLEIMVWALQQHDPDGWLTEKGLDWVKVNDQAFKSALDKYKYAVRFPQASEITYRQQAEGFIQKIEQQLSRTQFLVSDQPRLADIAVFPFVRQFAGVDADWFAQSSYQLTYQWLDYFLQHPIFLRIMQKNLDHI